MNKSIITMAWISMIIFIWSSFQTSFASSENTNTGVNLSELENIGTLLNHQDFVTAETKAEIFFNTTSEKEILQTSYKNFLTIIGLYFLNGETAAVKDLISKRWDLFPHEKNLCSLSTRYYGYSTPCIWSGSGAIFTDSAEHAAYLIYNKKWSNEEIEKYLKSLVPKAITLQNKSDLWNIIGYYSRKHPKRAFTFIAIQRKLWKEILKKDPAWVNGYLLLRVGYKETSSKWKKIMQDLEKNYIWDENRIKSVIQK